MPKVYPFIFSFLLLVVSCGESRKATSVLTPEPLRYAVNITCERGDGLSVWTLRNPWDTTQVLHRYILSPAKGSESLPLRGDLEGSSSIIQVPVRRAGVATAVHCGLLDELGVGTAIAGVCEKEFIDLPLVKEGLANGHIADFGNGMNPNVERIMDVHPDVLLLTPFEHSGGYGRVEHLGIPIVECAEYMEVSPLARAEWMLFYAELFGVEECADSIFNAVEQNYLELKQKTHKPEASSLHHGSGKGMSLLTEMLYGGQWFVPCGQSTMGIMYADAGAHYLFSDRKGSGSVALPFESVLDVAQDADVWLVKYNSELPLTYSSMAQDYRPYTRFRAYQERHIWSCDLAHNHFYEETPFHPERLLRDLILILHPELLPGEHPRYYHPLQE